MVDGCRHVPLATGRLVRVPLLAGADADTRKGLVLANGVPMPFVRKTSSAGASGRVLARVEPSQENTLVLCQSKILGLAAGRQPRVAATETGG
jgi:hypothetical protein